MQLDANLTGNSCTHRQTCQSHLLEPNVKKKLEEPYASMLSWCQRLLSFFTFLCLRIRNVLIIKKLYIHKP